MSQLTVNAVYPTALPLPSISYSGEPRNSTIISKDTAALLYRRSRNIRSYGSLSVQWVLTLAEWTALRAFISTTLHGGVDAFKIELRYPNNTSLTEWAVRFQNDVDGAHDEGMWKISAVLDLVNPVDF
jgi:hypothetical protein